MDKLLNDIFYSPEKGFKNVNELYKDAKKINNSLSFFDVLNWYNSQEVNQSYKQKTDKKQFASIICPFGIGCIQADLADFSKFKKQNNGVTFLLNCVDIYSRYAWSFPLKNKKSSTVAKALENVFININEYYPMKISITVDGGSEFKREVNKLLDKYGVIKYTNVPNSLESHSHMGIVERFNRTLRFKIAKYMASYDTLKYIDVLPDLIYNYNNTVHGTTKQTPYNILTGTEVSKQIVKKADSFPFSIGDKVRYRKTKKQFGKSDKNTFSVNKFTIKDIYNGKFLLSNGKLYNGYDLLDSSVVIGPDLSTFSNIYKSNENYNKKDRRNKQEPAFKDVNVSNLIINRPRNRKKKKIVDV